MKKNLNADALVLCPRFLFFELYEISHPIRHPRLSAHP